MICYKQHKLLQLRDWALRFTRKKSQGEPMWKRRLQEQVKHLRKDLSRVEELRKGRTIKTRFQEQLQRKY